MERLKRHQHQQY